MSATEIHGGNAGWTARELARRDFQEVVQRAIDKHAQAIQQTREFMADLSVEIEALKQRLSQMETQTLTVTTHGD